LKRILSSYFPKKGYLLLIILCYFNTGAQEFYLFVGTYTDAEPDKGIYVYRFNSKNGELHFVSNAEEITNPSYLAISPNGKNIYACTETQMPGKGSISSFSFDSKSGKLTFLNKVSSEGENPVYVSVHKSGQWLVNGNYTGGNASVSQIMKDGSIEPSCQNIIFKGKSIISGRQDSPHIHSTVFSPDQKYIFMPDLGSDKIWSYKVKPGRKVKLTKGKETNCIEGSGPRHITFHPNNKFAFCSEELSGTVAVYQLDNGNLKPIQRIVAHDSISHGPFGSADIHASPDGKFLYISNRGEENNIAIYSIDQTTSIISLKGYHTTLGLHPRNFVIDPTGKYLLVGNLQSNNIVVFERHSETGLLKYSGTQISVQRPACLKMTPVK
jgi:6-phosphogluconolactonase (cycloisomerase 2 family)